MNRKYKLAIVNLLIAIAISLIVNFSYILSMFMQDRQDRDNMRVPEDETLEVRSGVLKISPDGYGYIVSADMADSVYASAHKIWRLGLKSGQSLDVTVAPPARRGANPVMMTVKTADGEPFDYGQLFNRPSDTMVFMLQLSFYIGLAFILLTIITSRSRGASIAGYSLRFLYCTAITLGMYFFAPVVWRGGAVMPIFSRAPMLLDPMEILKCSFTLAVTMLYGRTWQLISAKQEMALENEHLKTENLEARYTTLVSQINPHFLFNSLNSLSMLVREDKTQSALTYIDRLSYVYRYIIRNEKHMLLRLSDEIEFLDAYKYLLEIRYADKLFFDIDIDPGRLELCLPALSLQPLLENAVKHNSITRNNPLHVTIRTREQWLEVSNPVRPKIEPEAGTGIGLHNLSSRYMLLTGRSIEIVRQDDVFTVRLPLIQPSKS